MTMKIDTAENPLAYFQLEFLTLIEPTYRNKTSLSQSIFFKPPLK